MVYEDPNGHFAPTPVAQRILDLIEKHADDLTKGWLAEIRQDDAPPGFLDTGSDMYQAMDLHNRVTLFFDRAIYYAVVGFEKA